MSRLLKGSGLFLRIQIFYVYFRVFLRIFLFSDILYVFSKTSMFLVALTYSRFFQLLRVPGFVSPLEPASLTSSSL